MSMLNNFINTLKYRLSKKSEPIFDNYKKIITDFTELTPKTQEPYDLNGRQVYISGPSKYGLFVCDRLTQQEKTDFYADYKEHYASWGGTPKYEWVYKSMACNSYNKFRLDIYKPGRMIVKCTLPKYTWASVWLYQSMNSGDFVKPWLLPIDKPIAPREYYFEIDTFETMMDNDTSERVSFSGHYGTQTNRQMKTGSICCWTDDSKPHFVEVVWDGTGNWTWILDSVVIQTKFISQPAEKIYPYLLLTLGMWDDYTKIQYPIMWKIDWIKISDNIITL